MIIPFVVFGCFRLAASSIACFIWAYRRLANVSTLIRGLGLWRSLVLVEDGVEVVQELLACLFAFLLDHLGSFLVLQPCPLILQRG